MTDYTMIQVRKINNQWYSQGTSMLFFDHKIKLKDGAILFAQDYSKPEFAFWTFESSIEEYDPNI